MWHLFFFSLSSNPVTVLASHHLIFTFSFLRFFSFLTDIALFIPNLASTTSPQSLISTPPALPYTRTHLTPMKARTHAHTPNPVLHFSFRRLSLQLQQCSQPASCQGLGAVYLWLCYHIALAMQLSPIQTRRNPVSYWPLMFNETEV